LRELNKAGDRSGAGTVAAWGSVEAWHCGGVGIGQGRSIVPVAGSVRSVAARACAFWQKFGPGLPWSGILE